MSFRLRVLGLMALVVIVATTVTAWLAFQQTSRQVSDSADAQRADVERISAALAGYGWEHGTWEGVASLVSDLHLQHGQRIRLVTEYGEVIVDSDTLAGRVARPVDSPPIPIDSRPRLELPANVTEPGVLNAIAIQEIDNYRSGVLLAACLTRRDATVMASEGPHGVPRYAPPPLLDTVRPGAREAPTECRERAGSSEQQLRDDAAWVAQCTREERPRFLRPTHAPGPLDTAAPAQGEVGDPGESPDRGSVAGCLAQAFAQRTERVAPVPLRLYLGAADSTLALSPGPVLAAAGLVATLAIAGSMLISRRVLRPIRALTTASHRLGDGDLSERVPVAGTDEIAILGRSFNRMADSLQRGEERQRRLTADVAHELRTPLANLRGYLEALKDGVLSPDPELFSSLYEEAVLQQRIVEDLQDLALAEAGSLVYHWSPVDLGELVESGRAAHQVAADAAGVRLRAASPGVPVAVRADSDRLRQVLNNLVGNALQATASGGSVTLAVAREVGWAVVTVTDTGAGIAPEHLPYVFDRFWRADPARGRRTGGSGLGLAIARQIVTDHLGRLEVASEPGSGTTFTVRLPLDDGAVAPQRAPGDARRSE